MKPRGERDAGDQSEGSDGAGVATRLRSVPHVAIVVLVAFFVLAAWQRRWIADDGFINLRVVHQLNDGRGFVYNPGQRVEVGTSPLWILLLWAASTLTLRSVDVSYLAVVLGIALAAAGLVAGYAGAVHAHRGVGAGGGAGAGAAARRCLPLGVLVVVALSPYWDFATSGLESGLAFGWLGASFLLVERGRRTATAALLLGLAPLVRPELALYGLAWLFVLLRDPAAQGRGRRRWRTVAWFASVPVVYEVFRAGYFASLVPNPALTKGASTLRPEQGARYLVDFVAPYVLPLILALVWFVARAALAGARTGTPGTPGTTGSDDGASSARTATTGRRFAPLWAAAGTHALYIVAMGGDYMHARMWLIPLFAALLPVFAVPERRVLAAGGPRLLYGAVCGWAVLAALVLRPPQFGSDQILGWIDDERSLWSTVSANDHPVTVEDYRTSVIYRIGLRNRELAEKEGDVLLLRDGAVLRSEHGFAFEAVNLGVTSIVTGNERQALDPVGLADPLMARMHRPGTWHPGHPPLVDSRWFSARIAPAAAGPGAAPHIAAYSCPSIVQLFDDVEAPLTVGKFMENITHSLGNTLRSYDEADLLAGRCDG